MKHERGFTLVELAIVMVIIGLLIGGGLKGQELIRNAKVNSFISQVNSYMVASNAFRDRFGGAMPGDITTATSMVPNCTSVNFCVNGNGDNIIGLTTANSTFANQAVNTMPQVETSMFWKHLALSDMIAGIESGANPATPEAGRTHPAGKLSSSMIITSKQAGGGGGSRSQLGIMLIPSMAFPTHDNNLMALTPGDAATIDRKMDDGDPNLGIISAEPAGNGCKTTDAVGGIYNELDDQPLCILFIKLFK